METSSVTRNVILRSVATLTSALPFLVSVGGCSFIGDAISRGSTPTTVREGTYLGGLVEVRSPKYLSEGTTRSMGPSPVFQTTHMRDWHPDGPSAHTASKSASDGERRTSTETQADAQIEAIGRQTIREFAPVGEGAYRSARESVSATPGSTKQVKATTTLLGESLRASGGMAIEALQSLAPGNNNR